VAEQEKKVALLLEDPTADHSLNFNPSTPPPKPPSPTHEPQTLNPKLVSKVAEQEKKEKAQDAASQP